MSFSIIYDKQFIKVGEKYLPIVLAGDSNVYKTEWTNGRNIEKRTRDFYSFVHEQGEKFLYTEEELIAYAENHRNDLIKRNEENEYSTDKYSDKSFGWFSGIAIGGRSCASTTYGNFKGVFTTGCKKALTVEQLLEFKGGSFMVDFHSFNHKFSSTARSTKELLEVIEQALEYERINNDRVYVSIYLREDELKWVRREFFPTAKKKARELIPGDKYFTLKYRDGEKGAMYGFLRFTKYGMKGSYSNGKKFFSKRLAEKQAQKLRERFPKFHTKIETHIVQ